jgi:hypothetical protein
MVSLSKVLGLFYKPITIYFFFGAAFIATFFTALAEGFATGFPTGFFCAIIYKFKS